MAGYINGKTKKGISSARMVKTKTGVMLADLVFHHNGHAIVDIRKAWATACRMAGVQECREGFSMICGARAVRNMIRAGVPERVAMMVSGHKTRSIFDGYNFVSERDLRDAMQRTQEYLIATAEEETKRQPLQLHRAQEVSNGGLHVIAATSRERRKTAGLHVGSASARRLDPCE